VAERGGARAGPAGKADRRQALLRRFVQRPVLAHVGQEAEGMAAMGLDGQRDIGERAELAQHRGDLERTAEPQLDAGVGRQPRHVAAGEVDGARIGREIAGDLADQGGLARAIGTDQGVDLARAHVDGDVVGGDQAAEALDQAVGREQRLSHCACRAARRCRRAHRAR
jgi:hypothetical protein